MKWDLKLLFKFLLSSFCMLYATEHVCWLRFYVHSSFLSSTIWIGWAEHINTIKDTRPALVPLQ